MYFRSVTFRRQIPLLVAILFSLLLGIIKVTSEIKEIRELQSRKAFLATAPNIIIIGWDGVQRDHLWECFQKELPECKKGLPNMEGLTSGEVFDITVTNGETETTPGWPQILSGYSAEVSGIFSNDDQPALPKGFSIFEKLEEYFGEDNIVTLYVSGKGAYINNERIDYLQESAGNNSNVGAKALELIEKYKDKKFFAFFLFKDSDSSGHKFKENSVEYSEKIFDEDQWLEKIITKLKETGVYEETLIYVTTDHGFDEGQDKHQNAPYGFLATNDPLVIRGGDRKDLAPTILERYGLSLGRQGNIPAVYGYPLSSIPPLSCIPEGEAFLDYPNSPKCCQDLRLIGLDKFKDGKCLLPTGGRGDGSGYCTKCGDGQCQKPENKCNCPVDCSG